MTSGDGSQMGENLSGLRYSFLPLCDPALDELGVLLDLMDDGDALTKALRAAMK